MRAERFFEGVDSCGRLDLAPLAPNVYESHSLHSRSLYPLSDKNKGRPNIVYPPTYLKLRPALSPLSPVPHPA